MERLARAAARRYRRVRGRQGRGHPPDSAHPELLTPAHGTAAATTILLYTGYNLAATLTSIPAGRVSDRLGAGGPVIVLAAGVACFAAAYAGFALTSASIAMLTFTGLQVLGQRFAAGVTPR